LALLVYFTANPHVLADGQRLVANADQLFPRYITNLLPAGLGGLVVAGMLAAAMSSLSAGVSSASSVVTVDFVDHFRRRKLAEAQHVKLARYVSVIIGALIVAISFYIGLVGGSLFEICYRVVNLFVAPLFVLFFMALFVSWATACGAVAGTACSVVVAVAIAFWEFFTGQKGLSFLWIMPMSLLAGAVTGTMASLLPLGARPKLSLAELKSGPADREGER
jgi:SSS family solute:Na+ symporter